MIDITTLPVNKQFTRRLIRPDTWIINCYDPNLASPHPYLIIGKERALLIDPTWTKLPLRKYIEEYVTDLPLWVVCTHSHLDHTNAAWMFDDLPIFMSEIAWEETQARRLLSDKEGRWMGHPKGTFTAKTLKPGDMLDLGGRVLEVLPYRGCHSTGSLLFLDRSAGVLFTGDEIECGQMLVGGRAGSPNCVELLRDNLASLKADFGGQFDLICPAHNGAPIDASFLDILIENCERILSGIEGDDDVGSMTSLYNPLEDRPEESIRKVLSDPTTKRSEWQGSSIVYNTQRITYAQVKEN